MDYFEIKRQSKEKLQANRIKKMENTTRSRMVSGTNQGMQMLTARRKKNRADLSL